MEIYPARNIRAMNGVYHVHNQTNEQLVSPSDALASIDVAAATPHSAALQSNDIFRKGQGAVNIEENMGKEMEMIWNHPLYRENYDKLKQAEEGRQFCRHQIEHLLAVARIAYIRNLEKHLGLRKELIYAAALLHDIGKYEQYAAGTPHEEASAQIAERILEDLPENTFSREEKRSILQAVRGHRRYREGMERLEELLYVSDKRSRNCFDCALEPACDWSPEKKNRQIEV